MRLAAAAPVLALCAAALAGDAPEGLELRLAATTKGPVQPGERIECDVRLVNTSRSLTHEVVRANQGSDTGRREPHVFWSATFVGKDGVERPVEAASGGSEDRLFVPEWWKDVTPLAPGASISVGFMTPPEKVFDVQDDGVLRLVAHYAWNAGKNAQRDPLAGGADAPADLGGMKGTLPYEIESPPVQIEIRRRFEVVAKPTRALRAGIRTPLSEAVDLRVKSRDAAPLRFDPDDWRVALVVDEKAGEAPDEDAARPRKGAEPFELPPGAETPLLRDGPLAAGRDVRVRFEDAGPARIAVVFERVSGTGPRIRSNWIDLKVEK